MNVTVLKTVLNSNKVGQEMHQFISELYPICRSITGRGFRETLNHISGHIPINIHEVPTGTQVFDWSIPKEWNIKDAYVMNLKGERVVDFQQCNLHVVSYSVPIRKRISLTELKSHIFTLPDQPSWIPYRTSYYEETWGFCLSHDQLLKLKDEQYDVCIDSTLEDGHLTYGELLLKGKTSDEILLSCHACHPSLCNDNLSGVALATFIAKYLSGMSVRHYSYRFLFIPGTIGSITWLYINKNHISAIKHGLVLSNVGDSGCLTYKRSRQEDAEVDRAAISVLKNSGDDYEVRDFVPYGYDERQFCSPGVNLPVGCFSRTPHGEFPEYHTSADNLSLVQPDYLEDSLNKCLSVLQVLDSNRKYVSQNPMCEPQLGRRGLYRKVGGAKDNRAQELALLWVLNLSDGEHSLLDISDRSGLSFDAIEIAADALVQHSLLKELVE